MSSIELAVNYSRSIESLLENKFGAAGRGLHEKLTSVEKHIPGKLAKQIRYVASVRNKIVHEANYQISDPEKFSATCEKVIHELNSISITSKVQSLSPFFSSFLNIKLSSLSGWLIPGMIIIVSGDVGYHSWIVGFDLTKVDWWGMFFDFLLTAFPIVAVTFSILLFLPFFAGIFSIILISPMLSFLASGLVSLWSVENFINTPYLFGKMNGTMAWFVFSMIGVVISFITMLLNFKSGGIRAVFFSSLAQHKQQTYRPVIEDDLIGKYSARSPNYSFKDVYGMAELKHQLLDAAENHKKEKANGILLTGDPGNGKTFIAEALAGELGWKFLPISIADIKSRWIGQTTEQLKAVFDAASRSAPLVLFFDECDSMLRDRGSMMEGNDESLQTANAFLTGIVDIRRHKNVIVIAASNYRDKLDEAAIRDQRFDFKIEIPNPDKEARRGLLLQFTGGVRFDSDVLERLTRRWEGFSVARMIAIAKKIRDEAKAQGRTDIDVKFAMAALRKVQGSMGDLIPEEVPTLRDGKLHFDSEQLKKLDGLARRMENIEEVERLGGQVPKGVLFFGPPGTGKTAVAKSLAKTSGWAFLATNGATLLKDGDEFKRILRKARDLRPTIIFIDEADDVLRDRKVNQYGTAVTNLMLAEMDGTGHLNDIMFIAATNHPNTLDPATVRSGRFGEHYEFKAPEDDTVVKIVTEWINTKKSSTPFHDDFTPDAVAVRLSGMSPSDIKGKLQQAVDIGVGRIMASEGAAKIMLADLEAVL